MTKQAALSLDQKYRSFVPARIQAVRMTEAELRQEVPDGMFEVGEGEGAPFLFPALVSNDGVDSYYTRMSLRTLTNFVNSLQEGTAFLDSHNTYRLPIGYSFNGRLLPSATDGGGEKHSALGMFYITPGIMLGASHSYQGTNDYIKAIKTSTARDVSVGFYGGRWICDLCGLDYWGGECPHVAGMEYEYPASMFRLATVTIDDAILTEVSAVYEGANQGAVIMKVEQRWAGGLIDRREREAIQTRFGIPLPSIPHQTSTSGLDLPQAQRSSAMHDEELYAEDVNVDAGAAEAPEAEAQAETPENIEGRATDAADADDDAPQVFEAAEAEALAGEVEETLRVIQVDENAEREFTPAEAVRQLRDQYVSLAEEWRQLKEEASDLQAQVLEMTALAEDGRAYRTDLIEQTVAEGVRVLGSAFPEPVYRGMLAKLPVAEIKAIRESFEAKAADVYPSGRQVQPGSGNGEGPKSLKVPAEAYLS